jgi:hypothetical protein
VGSPLRMVPSTCSICGGPFIARAYGSRVQQACSGACRSLRSSRTLARTNRLLASDRMRARNPMRHESVRSKVSATLRAIGHGPRVRGGNGRGPTETEAAMSAALGWPTNVIVPTRQPRGSGYPTHYKLDVANRSLRVAIEIDGSSHCALARRAQDKKKTAFLMSLGWTVIRVSADGVRWELPTVVKVVERVAAGRAA